MFLPIFQEVGFGVYGFRRNLGFRVAGFRLDFAKLWRSKNAFAQALLKTFEEPLYTSLFCWNPKCEVKFLP